MKLFRSPIIWRLMLWSLLLSLIPLAIVLVFIQREISDSINTTIIANETQNYVAMLSNQIAEHPDQVNQIIINFNVTNTTAFVINMEGTYIAHTNPQKIRQQAKNDFAEDFIHALIHENIPGEGKGLPFFLHTHISSHSSTTDKTLQILSHVHINSLSWIVVVTKPGISQTDAFNELSGNILFQLSISLLITSLLSSIGIIAVTNPLLTLAKYADQYGHGEFETRINIDKEDLEGELKILALSLNSMADRVQENILMLENRVKDRTRALTSSVKASQELSSILNRTQLIQKVIRSLLEAFNYYHISIFLTNVSNENELVLVADGGKTGEELVSKNIFVKLGIGLVGKAAASKKPVLISDVSKSEQWIPEPLLPDTKSEVSIPIKSGSEVMGVIDIQEDKIDGILETDIDAIQTIANQTAIALRNAELIEQLSERTIELEITYEKLLRYSQIAEESAITQERVRLARELHDSVSQTLYGITLQAEAIARLIEANKIDIAKNNIRDVSETSHKALKELRLLIYELRPSELDEKGLFASLQARLENVEEKTGINTKLIYNCPDLLSRKIELELYRIIQEALNNSLKHSKSKSILVSIQYVGHKLVMKVIDNGKGFDFNKVDKLNSIGLQNMIGRAKNMGGELFIDSIPNKGTKVIATIPLSPTVKKQGSVLSK